MTWHLAVFGWRLLWIETKGSVALPFWPWKRWRALHLPAVSPNPLHKAPLCRGSKVSPLHCPKPGPTSCLAARPWVPRPANFPPGYWVLPKDPYRAICWPDPAPRLPADHWLCWGRWRELGSGRPTYQLGSVSAARARLLRYSVIGCPPTSHWFRSVDDRVWLSYYYVPSLLYLDSASIWSVRPRDLWIGNHCLNNSCTRISDRRDNGDGFRGHCEYDGDDDDVAFDAAATPDFDARLGYHSRHNSTRRCCSCGILANRCNPNWPRRLYVRLAIKSVMAK